jgi:hypothetical protein
MIDLFIAPGGYLTFAGATGGSPASAEDVRSIYGTPSYSRARDIP